MRLRRSIRGWILFFMIATILSGLSAQPLDHELSWLNTHDGFFPGNVRHWISTLQAGIAEAHDHYAFLLYGFDWLAFAHYIIAMLLIGPFLDPVRNTWVINWSIACCILVFPFAFIMGPVRGIPLFHILTDCAFGLFGLFPLLLVRKKIRLLANFQQAEGA